MLGVVIANWNGEKILDKCLESFKLQEFTDYKLYIVDNGSKDKSLNIIRSYEELLNIELIELKENSGFAKANNLGIKKAIGDGCEYILTINNDTELEKDCLSNVMKNIEENKNEFDVYQLFMINFFDRHLCDATGITWDHRLLPSQLGYKQEIESITEKNNDLKGVCAGAAVYSAKSLKAVQLENGDYFDSKFFAYYEDVDLSIRLFRKGFKAKLIKNAIIYHIHSATGVKTNGFKEYYMNRNMLVYTKRNLSEKQYNKYKYVYYKIIIANMKNNLNNPKVLKSLYRALIDGIKLAKETKSEVDI